MAEDGKAVGLPLVVKIGGSLVETGRIKEVLAMVAAGGRAVVVVPGGGPFADSVRHLQIAMKFDDAEAHRLAMLAMHQMADLFLELEPRLRLAESFEAIATANEAGQPALWVPLPMMAHDRGVPADWSVSSDSLAARLGERLGGAPLALVKSVSVSGEADAAVLAAAGVVDRAFPDMVARSGIAWRVFGPDDEAALADVLAIDGAPLRKS